MKKLLAFLIAIIMLSEPLGIMGVCIDYISPEVRKIISGTDTEITAAEDFFDFSELLSELKKEYKSSSEDGKGLRLIVQAESLENGYGSEKMISDGEGMYVLQYNNAADAEKIYDYLNGCSFVSSVSFDKTFSVLEESTNPLENSGRNRYGAKRIESDRYKKALASNGKKGKIVVAVIDTGVYAAHPLLKGRIVSGGYDFVGNDKEPEDNNMHGTHCSGIIADNTPSNVKILPIKAFNSDGTSDDSTIVLAINYAVKSGVDVISMSFGSQGESEIMHSAIKKAYDAGIVLVAAAGNDGEDAKNEVPAAFDECITVGAVDKNDNLAEFSNYGKCVDLCAPGVDIWSGTLKELGTYAMASGTSMAAPFVSAASAMLLTDDNKLSPASVKARLQKATVDLGVKGKDSTYGAGVLDFGVLLGDKKAATGISLSKKTVELTYNKKIKFAAEKIGVIVTPSDATDKSYSITVSDTSVASFNGVGFVGKTGGKTSAAYKLTSQKASAKLSISVTKRKFWIDSVADSYASGSGTQKNPYIIKTAEQLARVSYQSMKLKLKEDTWFKVAADIDLGGKTWYPILARNKDRYVCRINFDGGGYTISNLQIQNISSDIFIYYAGLFGTNMGEMKNIVLKNVNINCPDSNTAGGICANSAGYIHNCSVQGFISSKSSGGIAGTVQPMSGTNSRMGVYDCRADVTLSGGHDNGGIVGLMASGTIANCFSNSKMRGDAEFGGIIGAGFNTLGRDKKYGDHKLNIINCVSTSGIAFSLEAEKKANICVRNCVYNIDSSFTQRFRKNVSIKGCIKTTDSKIKTAAFYKDSSNWLKGYSWNIGKKWKVNNDYPVVSAQKTKVTNTEFDYYEYENYVEVTAYNGKNTTVTIPSKINDKPVSYIASELIFKNVEPLKVVFPASIKRIPFLVFSEKARESIAQVVLGKNVQFIDEEALRNIPGLSYIEFPKKVKYIGAKALCYSGVKLVCFNCDKPLLGSKAFQGCSAKFYADKTAKGWGGVKLNKKSVKIFDSSSPLKFDFPTEINIGYNKTAELPVAIYPLKFKTSDLKYKVENAKGIKQVKGNIFKCTEKGGSARILIYYKGKKVGEVNAWYSARK